MPSVHEKVDLEEGKFDRDIPNINEFTDATTSEESSESVHAQQQLHTSANGDLRTGPLIVNKLPVVRQLIEMSNRIRDTSSEGVWDTVDPRLVEAAKSIGRKQRQEEWKNKRSREADSWNSALDAGRVKKVKGEKLELNSNENHFQKFQDNKMLK